MRPGATPRRRPAGRPSALPAESIDRFVDKHTCREIDSDRSVRAVPRVDHLHDALEVREARELDRDLAPALAERHLHPGLEPVAEPVREVRQAGRSRSGAAGGGGAPGTVAY